MAKAGIIHSMIIKNYIYFFCYMLRAWIEVDAVGIFT